MALTVCTGTVFALGEDVDISIGDDEDEEIVEPEIPSNVDSFENVSAGNVKVTIANNTEDLYMYNAGKDTYSLVPTGPAPSGDKWGMFTNFAYPTHQLIDGEYVEIEGAYKKGAYCGDNHFPINAIKGAYQHTYYTDYNTDQALLSTVTVASHSGDVMIGMGQMYRTGIKAIENLIPYTDYELSIWVYMANNCGYVKSLVVADNYDGVQTDGLVAYSDDCTVLGANNYYDTAFTYGEWQKLTVSFSTLDKTTAYLHISQNGLGTDGNRGMIFLDDLLVEENENNKYLAEEEYASVYVSAIRNDDGKLVVSVVNVNAEDVRIHINFDKAINKTLYRYICESGELKPDFNATLSGADKTYGNVKDKFTDLLPGGSIAIYTEITN